MAFWLIAAIFGLLGLFVLMQSGMAGLDALPALPIAAAVIATLIAVYILSSRSRSPEPVRFARSGAIAAALTVFAAAGAFALKSQGALQGLIPGIAKAPEANYSDGKDGPRAVRLRKRDGGQFMARAEVNGVSVDLMVDTGATDVVLKHADAERAGIDTSALTFSTPVNTGNGTAYAAPVRLRAITIGPIRLEGVEALVAKPGSVNESLLGMSFLRRLRSYELAGEFLTLRQ